MPTVQQPDEQEREAVWRMFRLEEPTFDDLTRGVFLGIIWCGVLWAPMFLDVLTR